MTYEEKKEGKIAQLQEAFGLDEKSVKALKIDEPTPLLNGIPANAEKTKTFSGSLSLEYNKKTSEFELKTNPLVDYGIKQMPLSSKDISAIEWAAKAQLSIAEGESGKISLVSKKDPKDIVRVTIENQKGQLVVTSFEATKQLSQKANMSQAMSQASKLLRANRERIVPSKTVIKPNKEKLKDLQFEATLDPARQAPILLKNLIEIAKNVYKTGKNSLQVDQEQYELDPKPNKKADQKEKVELELNDRGKNEILAVLGEKPEEKKDTELSLTKEDKKEVEQMIIGQPKSLEPKAENKDKTLLLDAIIVQLYEMSKQTPPPTVALPESIKNQLKAQLASKSNFNVHPEHNKPTFDQLQKQSKNISNALDNGAKIDGQLKATINQLVKKNETIKKQEKIKEKSQKKSVDLSIAKPSRGKGYPSR